MSRSESEREGGGLAVVVIAGVLVTLLLLCLGGGIYYVRHLQRMEILEAQRALLEARAAAERAQAVEAATRSGVEERSRPGQATDPADPNTAPTK